MCISEERSQINYQILYHKKRANECRKKKQSKEKGGNNEDQSRNK